MRADQRGVSAVIGEIFLVAITVVLVAFLFSLATSLTTQTISPQPALEFGPYTVHDGNVSFPVAGVTRPFPATRYGVNLIVDGKVGSPQALRASSEPVAIAVGGGSYLVTWTDVGGEGNLGAGDTFLVSDSGAPLASHTSFRFVLLWSDGSQVQSLDWTT